MTTERFLAFAAGKSFKLCLFSILQGHIDPALLLDELALPSIADKGLEKKLDELVQSTVEIAKLCHNQRKVNF